MSSLFLSRYFPVLEKSFMTGYMLMGEGCPLSGKRCCLTVLPKASVTAAGKFSHSFCPNPALTVLSKASVTATCKFSHSFRPNPALTVPSKASVTATGKFSQCFCPNPAPTVLSKASVTAAGKFSPSLCKLPVFVTHALAQRRPHSYDDY